MARALLTGRSSARIARESGVPVADEYTVLAVAAGPGDRYVLSFTAVLSIRCGQPVPALLGPAGGTILVPGAAGASDELADLAAGTPLVLAATTAARDRIPVAAGIAHELLEMVCRIYARPGLYRFDDLALEYQLTRPGPGRDRLAALLDPVSCHPELMSTLRVHLHNDLNRRRTSRMLHIHENTVDYRLKRIGQLAGLDITRADTLWQLRAALVARSYAVPAARFVPATDLVTGSAAT
ncbi:PucR family transcriptional regulator, partial [Nocardia sp. NPDC003345]